MSAGIADAYAHASRPQPQAIPIKPAVAAAGQYPLDALSPRLQGAARAIIDKVQVPAAIAANSVLAAASLGAQAYVDVELPTGEVVPASLYLVTVASSGDRKSSCDKLALYPVRKREEEMRHDHHYEDKVYQADLLAFTAARKKATTGNKSREEIKQAVEACGDEPRKPVQPLIVSDEGTLVGLQKLFAEAMPSLGLFSDEGGQWLGGHAMSEENRGATGAALSKLWDGAAIKRVRGADGFSFLPGRRLAVHLMIQHRIAERLFGDKDLKDQGLLSRILVASPETMKGTRLWKDPTEDSTLALEKYGARLHRMLTDPPPMDTDTRELKPRRLTLSDDARDLFKVWHDTVEADLAPGGAYEDIQGFAAKLPEHSVRIAAVMAFFEDRALTEISAQALSSGIKIAQFHAAEALRVIGVGSPDEITANADALIRWIRSKGHPVVGKRWLAQNAFPRHLRSAPVLNAAIEMLVDNRHLVPIKGGAEMTTVEPVRSYRDAYSVSPEDPQ